MTAVSSRRAAPSPQVTQARTDQLGATQSQGEAGRAVVRWRGAQAVVTGLEQRAATLKTRLETGDYAGQPEGKKLQAERAKVEGQLIGARKELAAARDDATRWIAPARQDADAVLKSKQRANAEAARANRPVPFPEAEGISSFEELERRPADVQKRVVGSVVVKDALGEAAAAQVNARSADAVAGANLLNVELGRAASPSQRAEVIDRAGPAISRITRSLLAAPEHDATQAVVSLGHAADRAGPEGAAAIARSMVSALPDGDVAAFAKKVGASVRDGAGAALGAELVKQLRAARKYQAAGQVEAELTGAFKAVHAEFSRAAKKVAKVDDELGRLVQGFGPVLSDSQLARAVAKFKEGHSTQYGNFDKASQKLAKLMEGAGVAWQAKSDETSPLAIEARKMLTELEPLAQTDAGQRLVARALQQDAAGGSSFLHQAEDVAKKVVKGAKINGMVATVVAQTVAREAVRLAADGRGADAAQLLQGMSRHADAFGVSPSKMEALIGKMDDVLSGDAAAPDALGAEVSKLKADASLVGPKAIVALKGLSAVLSIASFAKGVSTFDQQQLAQKISTVATGVKAGAETGMFVLKVLGKSADTSRLFKAAEVAGKGAGVLFAVIDGFNGAKAIAAGDGWKATADFASALGGILMVIPSMQLPGALVSLGALGLKQLTGAQRGINKAEAAAETDARAFLEGAGIGRTQAKKLSDLTERTHHNVGPFIAQLAKYAQVDPHTLFARLAALPPDRLAAFVDRVKNIVPDSGGDYAERAITDGTQVGTTAPGRFGDMRFGPQSLEAMRQWMVAEKLAL